MKAFWFIFLFLMWLSVCGQDLKHDQRYPGYFVNVKGDTIRGFILNKNKLDNQKTTEYSNDAKGEKIKLNLLPDQITGFKVGDLTYQVFDHGESDPLTYHFILLREDGELKLYEFFTMRKDEYITAGNSTRRVTGYDEQYLMSEFIVMKNEKMYVLTNQNSFMKNADDLFSDDQDLLLKISNKEKNYRYSDFPLIVKEYNSRASGQK